MSGYIVRCREDGGQSFHWWGRRSTWFHWHIGSFHVGWDRG